MREARIATTTGDGWIDDKRITFIFCRQSVWFKEFVNLLPYYTSWPAFIKKKPLDLIEGVSIQLSKYSAPVDLILGPETRVSFSKYLSFVKIIYIANIKIFMR